MYATFLVAFFVQLISQAHTDGASKYCSTGQKWAMDPEDCNKFYMCVFGREVEFTCPGVLVASSKMRSCVRQGSKFDTFSIGGGESPVTMYPGERPPTFCTKKVEEVPKICSFSQSEKLEHPESCSKYYDCAQYASGNKDEQLIKECEYPYLFNGNTRRCEHYTMVDCGNRHEPKNKCEYESGQCRSAHCVPCHIRHPSCRGLKDGLNPWIGRERSPFFVVCENERVIYQGQCPQTSTSHQLFSTESKMCKNFDTSGEKDD